MLGRDVWIIAIIGTGFDDKKESAFAKRPASTHPAAPPYD